MPIVLSVRCWRARSSRSSSSQRAGVLPVASSKRRKGACPHAGALGEGSDGMAGGKMLVQIVKQLTEAQALSRLRATGRRTRLRLTAVAMGRDDQAARRRWRLRCRNLHAPDADKGRSPPRCRRKSSAKHRPRKGRPPPPGSAENGTAAPRCSASGLSPGGHWSSPAAAENEHPGTDRNNPTSAGVGGSQRGAQRLGDRGVDAAPAGTTIVSAWARVPGPPSVIRRMPPVAHSGPSSTAATATWYQLSPISGRGGPKISRLRQTQRCTGHRRRGRPPDDVTVSQKGCQDVSVFCHVGLSADQGDGRQ